ncbi:MAG: hypothetical protein AAFU66_05585 [Pseudomonadota bacterium]
MRLSNERRLFETLDRTALRTASELAVSYPEKRGVLSHSTRALLGLKPMTYDGQTVTIEAHFDSVALEPDMLDFLARLGFETDGFHAFVPEHFSEHHTLKFKVDARAKSRVGHLHRFVMNACGRLWERVESDELLEAYLEVEQYGSANRRHWLDTALDADWTTSFPFSSDQFDWCVPPVTALEAEIDGVDLDVVKRADIHAKLAPSSPVEAREALVAMLEPLGFYRVVTLSGNHVCTGQFKSGRDAQAVFDDLCTFFDDASGCTEITLEPARMLRRSVFRRDGETRHAALPPLILDFDA